MSRMLMALAALLAVAALGAGAASTASASWFVNNTKLPESTDALISSTAQVDKPFRWRIVTPTNQSVSVSCKGPDVNFIGGDFGNVDEEGGGLAEEIIFDGCETTEPATGCELGSTEIPIWLTAFNASTVTTKSDRLIFRKAHLIFVRIPFGSGSTCSVKGGKEFYTSFTMRMPTGQEENTVQTVEAIGSVENNSLEDSSKDKAYIEEGRMLLRLQSGASWSFH